MRILHTSDWHLDRSFNRVRLLESQVRLLDWLVNYAKSEGVDVVVIAGDIYDQQAPSSLAVEALDHVLSELAAAGIKVIGISGNHDSAIRVSFLERVATTAGISIRGNLAQAGVPVVIPETRGDHAFNASVAFYPIPYIEPHLARHVLDAPDTNSHDALLRIALDRSRTDLAARTTTSGPASLRRSMAIVHAFVTGGQPSDSERELTVGGSSEVGLGLFEGFDYAALGHLHGRQSFGSGRIRYSGSLMPYSFSEAHHTKGAWLIDLPPSGEMRVQAVDFPIERPLAKIRGSLSELLTNAEFVSAEGAFVQATLTDPTLPDQALEKLRRRFPHVIELGFDSVRSSTPTQSFREATRGKSDLDLTADFFNFITETEATDEIRLTLSEAIDAERSLEQ